MRHMKHIKIYEAFNSELLRKTISFLEKNKINSKTFLQELKSIFKDIQLSKISDDNIKYMSAKKAETYSDGDDLIFKFWFSLKNGFIAHTKIDKIVDTKSVDYYGAFNEEEIKIIKIRYFNTGYLSQIKKKSDLKTGDIIVCYIVNAHSEFLTTGTYFQKDGIGYIISDDLPISGNKPDGGSWRQYGKISWCLGGINYEVGEFSKLNKYIQGDIPLKYDKDIKSNTLFNLLYNSYNGEYYVNNEKFKSIYDDSDFAIIINMSKIDNGLLDRKSIIDEREKNRHNALALIDNKEIKQKNIESYISKIFSNIEKDNYKDINKIILYSLGYKFGIFAIFNDRLINNRENIINRLYNLLTNEHYTEDNLKIKNLFIRMYKIYMEFLRSANELEKLLLEHNNEKLKKIIQIIISINEDITNYLNKNVENIDDINIVMMKIEYIKSLINNYKIIDINVPKFLETCNHVIESYNKNDKAIWLDNFNLNNYDSFIKSLEKIKKIVKEVF